MWRRPSRVEDWIFGSVATGLLVGSAVCLGCSFRSSGGDCGFDNSDCASLNYVGASMVLCLAAIFGVGPVWLIVRYFADIARRTRV